MDTLDINYIQTEFELPEQQNPKHYGMVLEPGKFVFKLEPLTAPQPEMDLSKFV